MEGKDFDDKAVMAATRQERGPNGSFRLKITLPLSGREVASEWIPEDKRRQALFAWVETIRSQAQSDIDEYEAERKARTLRERAEQSRLVAPDGSPATASVSIPAVAAAPSAPAPTAASPSSLTSNPDDYIADQLKRALIREVEASEALVAAQRAHEDAVASLAKWQKLNEALGA